MIRVHCYTNIDCCKQLDWPKYLPTVSIGHRVRSSSYTDKHVELQVVGITWVFNANPMVKEWGAHVELHLCDVWARNGGIPAFAKAFNLQAY